MKHARILIGLVIVIVCAGGAPATAQTVVVNPTTIEWDPSSDHAALGLDGQPLVARYDVEIYLESQQTTPVVTWDAGKPTPEGDGKIRIVNASWFVMSLLNVRHVAKVTAIGPTGVGRSVASNPFGTSGPPSPPANPTVGRSPSGSGGSSTAWGSAWFGSLAGIGL